MKRGASSLLYGAIFSMSSRKKKKGGETGLCERKNCKIDQKKKKKSNGGGGNT